jgi:transposase
MRDARDVAGRPSYDELAALVVELRAVVAEQKAQIAVLQARLGGNSRNSSRPPSSDGYGKPSATKRSLRERSGRKPGGQPGSPGHHLARRDDPDETVTHAVVSCGGCGRDLRDAPVEDIESRQVLDLPELPGLRCVEHLIEQRRCAGCGESSRSSFPDGVSGPVQYGPRIRALGIYLVCYQHLPYERSAELLSDWVGASVSVGSLQSFIRQGADGLEGFLAVLRGQLKHSEVVGFDETGARIDGQLDWIHSASTDGLTLYTAHHKRGSEGIDAAGVLPGFEGVAVHDGWAPYRSYEQALHALCNAHHLRELVAAKESGQNWAQPMIAVLLNAKHQVDLARQAGLEHLALATLAQIAASYSEAILNGYNENPDLIDEHPARRPKRTKAQNLLLRLDERETETLRFAHDFRVPFDNNLSERDLRMIKLQQKISGCWRTSHGAERFLAIRSYISTARKQGHTPLRVLTQLAAGSPWIPAPRAAPG